MARQFNELKDVIVVDVQVQNYSTILVNTTATQLLIQTRIDFPERDRTRGT